MQMVRKNNPLVTKSMLDEAVDAILKGVDALFRQFKGEVDKRFDKVESEINFVKTDVRDIKADLSNTPSRKEFNELKTKVDRYHPQV